MKDELEKKFIMITYADDEVSGDIEVLKRQIKKRDMVVMKTNDGLIDSKIKAAGPENIKDYLDQTIYVAVFLVSSYFAGMIGQAGAERYQKLSYQISKFVSKVKSKKDALFIVEIERENNYSLKICFVINTKNSANDIIKSLNEIPVALKTMMYEINKFNKESVARVIYRNNKWDLNNKKFLKINYGTTTLIANRVLKGFGVCEKKYFPDDIKKGQTEWEYMNEVPPPEAIKNALTHIVDYYQRLYTVDDIKNALRFAPVTISFEMYESFLKAPNGNISMPAPEEKKITGHCVTIIGYNKTGFIFANSWGRNWGDNGKGVLPYEYLDKYLIESWGAMTFFDFKKIFNFKRIFKINIWKNYFKYKRIKGISRRGKFTDSANRNIKYEVYGSQAMTITKRGIIVVDLFHPSTNYKRSGWGIFSANKDNNVIEIEDVFVDQEFSNAGWGSKIISLLEEFVSNWSEQKIMGWANIVDAKDKFLEKRITHFFEKNGFSLVDDKTRFPGAYKKVEKIINKK